MTLTKMVLLTKLCYWSNNSIGLQSSVWGSDYMMIRHKRPDLYECGGDTTIPLEKRQIAAYLTDTLGYYSMTTMKEDFYKMTKNTNCAHRLYEIEKIEWFEDGMYHAQATQQHFPHPKPYIIEYTDAGPGIGVTNYEVRFRECEIAQSPPC